VKFWDSSAVVPLALRQPKTTRLESLLRKDRDLALWWGTPLECASALARVVREKLIDAAAARASLQVIQWLSAAAFEVPPAEAVRSRAIQLLSIHPLRAADALQLAAGLIWCRNQTAGAEFVCLDEHLRDAALAEGFTILP